MLKDHFQGCVQCRSCRVRGNGHADAGGKAWWGCCLYPMPILGLYPTLWRVAGVLPELLPSSGLLLLSKTEQLASSKACCTSRLLAAMKFQVVTILPKGTAAARRSDAQHVNAAKGCGPDLGKSLGVQTTWCVEYGKFHRVYKVHASRDQAL